MRPSKIPAPQENKALIHYILAFLMRYRVKLDHWSLSRNRGEAKRKAMPLHTYSKTTSYDRKALSGDVSFLAASLWTPYMCLSYFTMLTRIVLTFLILVLSFSKYTRKDPFRIYTLNLYAVFVPSDFLLCCRWGIYIANLFGGIFSASWFVAFHFAELDSI